MSESKEELQAALCDVRDRVQAIDRRYKKYLDAAESTQNEISALNKEKDLMEKRVLECDKAAAKPARPWRFIKRLLSFVAIFLLVYSAFHVFFGIESTETYQPLDQYESALEETQPDYYAEVMSSMLPVKLLVVAAYVLSAASIRASCRSEKREQFRPLPLAMLAGALCCNVAGFLGICSYPLASQLSPEIGEAINALYWSEGSLPLMGAAVICELGHFVVFLPSVWQKRQRKVYEAKVEELASEIRLKRSEVSDSVAVQKECCTEYLEEESRFNWLNSRIVALEKRGQALCDAEDSLEALVGLDAVKQAVNRWKSRIEFDMERGADTTPNLNFLFLGNPGTGKTEVARIMGKLLYGLGFLVKSDVVEVDRSKLVAGYVGQTAGQTQKAIDEACGGVLFVDEAYTLYRGDSSSNDFGKEAIETIMKAMEDNRGEIAFIFAGYENEMEVFLDANPGLRSRLPENNRFMFEGYSPSELTEITARMLSSHGFALEDGVKDELLLYFEGRSTAVDFGNARGARNLSEELIDNQSQLWHGDRERYSVSSISVDAVRMLQS